MKKGTPRHPKVFELCRLLKISRPTAVGYLELLWHMTAEYAPQGDIGKFPDIWIEASLDWDGPTGKLVSAFLDATWLQKSPLHRLVVHDWHEHCDQTVRKRLSRLNLPFLSYQEDSAKVTGQCSVTDWKKISSREAMAMDTSLLRNSEAEERKNGGGTPEVFNPSDRFEEFWRKWPRRVKRDAAFQAWISVVSAENDGKVFACLARFLSSRDVEQGVVGYADAWLSQQARDDWAGDWPRAAPARSKLEKLMEDV